MDYREEDRKRHEKLMAHVLHHTAEQSALDPELASVIEEAKRDFPRALLTVSPAHYEGGHWNSWFQCQTEDGSNVFCIHGSGATPYEAAKSIVDRERKRYRLPFYGRTSKEAYDDRLDLPWASNETEQAAE